VEPNEAICWHGERRVLLRYAATIFVAAALAGLVLRHLYTGALAYVDAGIIVALVLLTTAYLGWSVSVLLRGFLTSSAGFTAPGRRLLIPWSRVTGLSFSEPGFSIRVRTTDRARAVTWTVGEWPEEAMRTLAEGVLKASVPLELPWSDQDSSGYIVVDDQGIHQRRGGQVVEVDPCAVASVVLVRLPHGRGTSVAAVVADANAPERTQLGLSGTNRFDILRAIAALEKRRGGTARVPTA
jgi:hypothetical protein